jgi:hypothetical protein
VLPVACTDRERVLTFYASALANTGQSSLARDNASLPLASAPREYQVRGMAIDDIVRELKLPRVDVIKIDVEGAELQVLQGARETLQRLRPQLVVEIGPTKEIPFNTKPEQVFSLFREAGYDKGVLLADEDWVFHPINPAAGQQEQATRGAR